MFMKDATRSACMAAATERRVSALYETGAFLRRELTVDITMAPRLFDSSFCPAAVAVVNAHLHRRRQHGENQSEHIGRSLRKGLGIAQEPFDLLPREFVGCVREVA